MTGFCLTVVLLSGDSPGVKESCDERERERSTSQTSVPCSSWPQRNEEQQKKASRFTETHFGGEARPPSFDAKRRDTGEFAPLLHALGLFWHNQLTIALL